MNEPTISGQLGSQQELGQSAVAPGAQLAAQRESRGWSIEQVAAQLNLAPRQIYAIETGNHAALPGMASVRGFIRAYAKLLKVDAAPLLAMIASDAPVPSEPLPLRRALSAAPFDNRSLSSSRPGLASKSVLAAVILILLLVVVFVGEQTQWTPDALSSKIKAMASASSAEPAASLSPAAPAVADEAQSNAEASGGAGSALTHEPVTAAMVMGAQPVAPVASAAPAASVTSGATVVAPAAATGEAKDTLVLKLHANSWVEIRHGDKSPLISRLLKAGAVETFEITQPMSMTLGNAAGVDATLRGIPLDLKSSAKNNVVRLNLK